MCYTFTPSESADVTITAESGVDTWLSLASTYADYQLLGIGGAGHYEYAEYVLQPRSRDCLYHVVEHAHPSWNAPGEYGFIISAGICESDLTAYAQQRKAILGSFNEIE